MARKYDVAVYPMQTKGAGIDEPDPLRFTSVDYISFVNSDTFGKPPLIADKEHNVPEDANILYINPALIVAVELD